jgi:galactokinase
VLSFDKIQPFIFGGKGIGSQGDGTCQLVACNAEGQKKAIEWIEKELKMSCLDVVIQKSS